MKATLHPYQQLIADHIVQTPNCAVWADMGVGKTLSTLTAIDLLMLLGDSERVLIVAPPRVAKYTWPAEIRKWDHTRQLTVTDLTGSDWRQKAKRITTDITVINYEKLASRTVHRNGVTRQHYGLVDLLGDDWPFDTVVLDESSKMKSPSAKRYKALRRVRGKINSLIELTGTPSPNGLQDLWSQAYLLDQGERLGKTLTAFRSRWFRQQRLPFATLYEPLPQARTEIQDKLKDIAITIRSEDWFDLREPVVVNRIVELPPSVKTQYEAMERDFFLELEAEAISAPNAAAMSNKCLQLANGFIYADEKRVKELHDVKLEALDEIIEESAGDPLLVAYTYQADRDRILKKFKQARTIDEPGVLDQWNAGRVPLLLFHPASAGHGLNLQDGGRRIVWFGVTWALELYQQANERIGPMRQKQSGYERNVFVYHILANDTLDTAVLDRLEHKSSVQDALKAAMAKRHV